MTLVKKIVRYVLKRFGFFEISTKKYDIYNKHFDLALNYYKSYLLCNLERLTDSEYLQYLEIRFGGYITDVKATITSETVSRIYEGNHTGGDRMNVFYHDYSSKYSEYLHPLKDSTNSINLLEIGILNGTGLAIWDTYFSNKQLFGFDYDLGNFENNKMNLISLGAFKNELPKLRFFDQFADNSKTLKETFMDNKIDVVIDDAFHSDESIINTFIEIQPYLNDSFIYFIEDNRTAWKKLKIMFPQYNFDYNDNELTVVTKNFNNE